jgi:hypothetical protein
MTRSESLEGFAPTRSSPKKSGAGFPVDTRRTPVLGSIVYELQVDPPAT